MERVDLAPRKHAGLKTALSASKQLTPIGNTLGGDIKVGPLLFSEENGYRWKA